MYIHFRSIVIHINDCNSEIIIFCFIMTLSKQLSKLKLNFKNHINKSKNYVLDLLKRVSRLSRCITKLVIIPCFYDQNITMSNLPVQDVSHCQRSRFCVNSESPLSKIIVDCNNKLYTLIHNHYVTLTLYQMKNKAKYCQSAL